MHIYRYQDIKSAISGYRIVSISHSTTESQDIFFYWCWVKGPHQAGFSHYVKHPLMCHTTQSASFKALTPILIVECAVILVNCLATTFTDAV